MKAVFIKTSNADVEHDAKLARLQTIKNPEPLVIVETAKDEEKVTNLAKNSKRVFVKCTDWKVIPLENLITKTRGKAELISVVSSAAEAKLALEVMELGVDGVLLETDSAAELQKFSKMLEEHESKERIELEEATVTKVQPIRTGARACLDTCMLMKEGQGMLLGSSSQGIALVQAEVVENKLASTRPFRVNAGAVSLYVMVPKNRTNYLEEMKAGNEVIVADREGNKVVTNVARSKVEIRPLVLVEAASKNGSVVKVILQNAETVRLVTAEGSKAVTELAVGDKIMAHFEEGARHFGMLLKEETIIEK
ncbi:3-dehydroquinate synthase II [Candidatus Micrarchaeota archaeon]|nr:3-dehydroquinate synthase II [Candidatus Micrarchaeota archaeon]